MKIKRILSLIMALAMVLCLFACSPKGDAEEGKDDVAVNEGSLGATDALNGVVLSDFEISAKCVAKTDKSAPAVWSDSTVVTENMFVYFYNAFYRNYLETYKKSLDSMGLDPSKSLSAQKYDDKYTWQQYITLQVYTQLREMMALADAAKAAGVKVDEEGKKEVNNQAAVIVKAAKDAGVSTEAFIEDTYGKGVTIDVMRAALYIRYMANKHYNTLWDGYTFTEEECTEYYKENSTSFLHFDVIKLTVPAGEDVDTLKACKDSESFISAARDIITKNSFLGDYDRFADTIEAQLQRKYCYRMNYDQYTELGKWAVEEGRQPYDIHTKKESTGNITVSMILPTTDPGAISEVLYRDDVPVKNVKYMLFADGEGTDGKVKAESILKNWQENPTRERFDELIAKYDGGTANGIYRGQFNDDVNAWVFAEGRKAGDCAVIDGDEGAYIIYMMEDGAPSWIEDVRQTLKENKYADEVEKFIEKYPTKYENDIVYNVVEVTVSVAADTTAE